MKGNRFFLTYGTIALILTACETCPAAPPRGAAPTAQVTCAALCEAESESTSHRFRNWVRRRVVCENDLARFGLQLDDGWQDAPPEKPLVVLIHGFNSTPERTAALVAPARGDGFPCGAFAYPNDYSLATATEQLSLELRALADSDPHRRVALVSHSMGGLVARGCLESPTLDPGNVDRLIMIAPPTHGSQLARFAVGTDVWEHWLSRKEGGPWRRTRDSIVDGLGEAADELVPESRFLAELNARPRNPNVDYTIVLGTSAVVDEEELVWIRENVCDKLMKLPGISGRAERLDAVLADIDELVDGKGDGVVAIKRGRLAGVEDTLVMRFNHMAVGGESDDPDLKAVYQAVLERLR
jgi:pimeloyl-ACP methyl ester carboxylesterase